MALNQKVFLYNVSGTGPEYRTEIYFSPSSSAPFLRVGDLITDSSNNTYKVITWNTSYPNPPTADAFDGVEVVLFKEGGPAPSEDEDYNSSWTTPGVLDVRPKIYTTGTILSSSVVSGRESLFSITASWSAPIEANNVNIGDCISTSTGKIYEIKQLETSLWGAPVLVSELPTEIYGVAPLVGSASLFRPTQNMKLYTGAPISESHAMRTRIRDSVYLDTKTVNPQIITLTMVDISNKYVDLTNSPNPIDSVELTVQGGPDQVYGMDYEIIATGSGEMRRLSWGGLDLDGILEENDKLIIYYQT